MNKSIINNTIFKLIYKSFIQLPTPININIWWNIGSLLGLCLIIQLITGIFLSIHYTPSINEAYNNVINIIQDINYGWIIRILHINGASIFFICLYLHIGRNIYYQSYNLTETWLIGVTIYLLTIITAFLGYVLPWGQISFWGATVITNLISAIPYIGANLVEWIWGGFSVNSPTLNRFYSLHFIIPFIISFLVVIHLIYLHTTGSTNPLGLNRNLNKIIFHKFFLIKDSITFIILIIIIIILTLQNPYLLRDPDNFIKANPIVTPIHIKPEWYFLFAYAILRAIPNKLGGVIALLMSIIILITLPFSSKPKYFKINFNIFHKLYFWILISTFFILTWLGRQEIKTPYIELTQFYSIFYFIYFLSINKINTFWFFIIHKK